MWEGVAPSHIWISYNLQDHNPLYNVRLLAILTLKEL
jgi:hypothetical protein